MMHIACLDMEGVLTPEVWVNVAERTGLEELKLTTRMIPDYRELMDHRLKVMAEHGLKLSDIQKVIADMGILEGAREFVDWLRARWQVVILSDTFYDFADPFIEQLGRPTILCHSLVVTDDRVVGYRLRQENAKYEAIRAFQSLNFTTLATGDSYNDTTMLEQADYGTLFNAPDNVIAEFPQLPVAHSYAELKQLFTAAAQSLEDAAQA